MSDNILVSQENVLSILPQFINDLKTKITNKDISLPYTTEFTKGSYLKIDGDGTMYLSNNGTYIKIGTITQDQLDIAKIYQIFSIKSISEHWDNTGILSIPTQKKSFGAVSYNGKIYCVGGNTQTTYIYDIASNTWSTGTAIPNTNPACKAVFYNAKIYCFCYYNTPNVYIYDIASNTWSTGANRATNGDEFGCAIYNDNVYITGGCTSSVQSAVNVYNITNNTWSGLASMPNTIRGHETIPYNNCLYVIGGYGSSGGAFTTVYKYAISSNTWSSVAAIPEGRKYYAYSVHNDNIYIFGGDNGSSSLNTVYIYNVTSNTWSKLATNIPIAREQFSCSEYNGKVYCISGYTTSTTDVLIYAYKTSIIPLPSSISTKLSKIISTGTGNKIFSNDGTYKTITPSYTVMDSATINSFLSTI